MRSGTLVAALLASSQPALAQDGTFAVKLLTPEVALKAAQSALDKCRKDGFQVAVAVTDRFGVAQVLLRDRFAGPHTVDVSISKAWTAATFKTATLALADASREGQPAAPIRHFARVVVMGGGIPIEAGGALLGAIAVSGAPGGAADHACAEAGIAAIRDVIEF